MKDDVSFSGQTMVWYDCSDDCPVVKALQCFTANLLTTVFSVVICRDIRAPVRD